jgi:hypothetical protein
MVAVFATEQKSDKISLDSPNITLPDFFCPSLADENEER